MNYEPIIRENLSALRDENARAVDKNPRAKFKVIAYEKALSTLPRTAIYDIKQIEKVGGARIQARIRWMIIHGRNLPEAKKALLFRRLG